MLPFFIPVKCTLYKLAGSPWFAWSIFILTLSSQPVLVFVWLSLLLTSGLEVDFLQQGRDHCSKVGYTRKKLVAGLKQFILGKTRMVILDFHSDFQLLDLSVAVSSLEASHVVENSLEKMKVMPLLS